MAVLQDADEGVGLHLLDRRQFGEGLGQGVDAALADALPARLRFASRLTVRFRPVNTLPAIFTPSAMAASIGRRARSLGGRRPFLRGCSPVTVIYATSGNSRPRTSGVRYAIASASVDVHSELPPSWQPHPV